MAQLEGQLNVIFNKISVNSVDSGAGIFVGTNTAYGWSSVHKVNNGFGSSSGCAVHHNCSIVYDNDQIDFPVEERGVYIHKQTAPAAQNITFQSIDVNAVTTNSSIAVGENNQSGWSSSGKHNMGEGRQQGINVVHNNFNTVMDQDITDAPVRHIQLRNSEAHP